MKNLGLQKQQKAKEPVQEPPKVADTEFAIFEDPPTVKVSSLQAASLSFTHSTPFAGSTSSANTEKPSITPIGATDLQAEASMNYAKRSAFARLDEDENASLSPILETSSEVSMMQAANISAISGNGNISPAARSGCLQAERLRGRIPLRKSEVTFCI